MSMREQIVEKARQMPHMPAPVMRIMNYLSRPDADLNVLAAMIEYDPGLTVNVLRMANSSFFGGGATVVSVRDALFRLGTRRVVQLVIASGVAPVAQAPVEGYQLGGGDLLRHSVAVGVAAELTARELGLTAPDHVFTAGLLCNLGKIVLGDFLGGMPDDVFQLAEREGLSFQQAERRLLGIDHAELGALLLEHWDVPGPITHCVRWHLDPSQAPGQGENPDQNPDLALDLVHCGHVLATMAGIGQGADGLGYTVCRECLTRLGLTQESMADIMASLVDAIEEIEEILGQIRQ